MLVEELHGPLVGDLVVDELARALPGDETARRVAAEMHRGVGLAQPGAPDDLARGQGPVAERLEDPEARGGPSPRNSLARSWTPPLFIRSGRHTTSPPASRRTRTCWSS